MAEDISISIQNGLSAVAMGIVIAGIWIAGSLADSYILYAVAGILMAICRMWR